MKTNKNANDNRVNLMISWMTGTVIFLMDLTHGTIMTTGKTLNKSVVSVGDPSY